MHGRNLMQYGLKTLTVRNVAQQWANMGPQMNKPLEHIWRNQKAMNNLNKQVMQAQGSFAATGRVCTDSHWG